MRQQKIRLYLLLFILTFLFTALYWYKDMPLPLSWEFKRFVLNNQLSGMVVAVKNSQGEINYWVYGERAEVKELPLSAQAPMIMASLSKPITGMTIRKLIAKGNLSLEDKLTDLLPELNYSKDDRFKKITVRHLLQHTAGFDHLVSGDLIYRDGHLITCTEAIKRALDKKLDYMPNNQIRYSNVGYCFLGAIIEKITHNNYESVVRQMLSEYRLPSEKLYLGEMPEHRQWNAQSSLKTTDLQKIGPVGGWVTDAETLLSIYSIELNDQQLIAHTPKDAEYGKTYYGLGWRVILQENGDCILVHYGSLMPAYYSFAFILPNGVHAVGFFEGSIENYQFKLDQFVELLSKKLSQ